MGADGCGITLTVMCGSIKWQNCWSRTSRAAAVAFGFASGFAFGFASGFAFGFAFGYAFGDTAVL